jgi:hypothetical protein
MPWQSHIEIAGNRMAGSRDWDVKSFFVISRNFRWIQRSTCRAGYTPALQAAKIAFEYFWIITVLDAPKSSQHPMIVFPL